MLEDTQTVKLVVEQLKADKQLSTAFIVVSAAGIAALAVLVLLGHSDMAGSVIPLAAMFALGVYGKFLQRKKVDGVEKATGKTWEELIAEVENKVNEAIEGRETERDEADAAKLGVTADEIHALGPGSRRILHDMAQDDADAFKELCARCVGGWIGGRFVDPFPMSVLAGNPYALDMAKLTRLSDLLLGDFAPAVLPVSSNAGKLIPLRIGTSAYLVKFPDNNAANFPYLRFTQEGCDLAKLCDLGTADGFEERAVSFFINRGCDVTRVDENILEDETVKAILKLR